MSGFQFSAPRLNISAFRTLRRSPEAVAWVARAGRKIAAHASAMSGEHYEFRPTSGRNRARGIVTPADADAARDSLVNLTLLRSIDAGRR